MSDVLHLSPETLDRPAASGASALGMERPLSTASKGQAGVITKVSGQTGAHEAVDSAELERRLLEMGFVEGALIEVLHEGLFGRDPIAVRIDDMRVALRRREAAAVTVQFHEA
ncbi:FeoA family protein [Caulobacter sp. DWR2-3-1b2]|uniref:FeoA family protein n=1 Tax=unclassified Caulobacter TaxID=2648921 RepID=UPI0019A9E58D|nr:ferrous iron transport protein A [Caulobacter sp.]